MTTALAQKLFTGALRGARRGERVLELLEALGDALGLEVEEAEERQVTPSAMRMRKHRASRASQASPGDVTGPPDEASHVTLSDASRVGGKGGDLSTDRQEKTHSLSGSEGTTPRERASRGDAGDVTPKGHAPGPREQLVELTSPITRELEAIASMQTVQDVAGAWAKFCGYYNGRTIDVAGAWQRWCVTEAKRERTERDRARRQGGGRPPATESQGGNPNPVSRNFELTPFDEARIAAARADREQDGRADVASARPASEPRAAFGGKR